MLGSDIAHEIRNPLNAISLNLDMLEEELHGIPGLEGSVDHLGCSANHGGDQTAASITLKGFLTTRAPRVPLRVKTERV